MNLAAIKHQTDSRFSYCIGGTAFRLIVQTAKGDDIKDITCLWNSYCHFYQKRNETKMNILCSDHLFDYYSCDIDNKDPAYSYIFVITDNKGQKLYLSETGFHKDYSFSTCFLDEFMACFPNPRDTIEDNLEFQGRLFYQIFPERFARGKDEPKASYINQDWNATHPDNLKYCGGDFQGIIEKLDYLKSIGVGAIYLNPIHPSPSAHKYDVNDYFAVDPMFGDMAKFQELVKKAHVHDIKIVMDLVFNHCCFYNNLFQDVVKNGQKSPYYGWFFIDGDKPSWDKKNYLTFADVRMMPKLNTNNAEVMEYLCKGGEYWLKEADVDGYRLDVAFEVSHAFWRMFKSRCVAIKKTCILIGEDWLNSESRLSSSEWDSVMNYPFRYSLQRFYCEPGHDASWLADELNGLLMRYQENTDRMMLNLLDSHDIARFFNYLKFDREKLLSAFALTIMYPGWPEIYMGDEIFMEGEGDPFNRQCMKWDSKEFKSEDGLLFKRMLLLRQFDILKKGDWKITSQDGYFLLTRHYRGNGLALYLNQSDKALSFAPTNVVVSKGLGSKGELAPHSFAIALC